MHEDSSPTDDVASEAEVYEQTAYGDLGNLGGASNHFDLFNFDPSVLQSVFSDLGDMGFAFSGIDNTQWHGAKSPDN